MAVFLPSLAQYHHALAPCSVGRLALGTGLRARGETKQLGDHEDQQKAAVKPQQPTPLGVLSAEPSPSDRLKGQGND